MIVKLIKEAEADIDDGYDLYFKIDPDRAPDFVDAITADTLRLRDLLFPHRERFGLHCAFSKNYPFSIYYQFDGQTVRVIGILDQRSSPKKHALLLNRRAKE